MDEYSKEILTYIRHENTLLKTELLSALQHRDREIKESKTHYDSKIKEIKEINDTLESKLCLVTEESCLEQQRLERLNFQLKKKLKILEDDLNFTKKESEETSQMGKQKEILLSENESLIQNLREKIDILEERVRSMEVDVNREQMLKQEFTISLQAEENGNRVLKDRLHNVTADSEATISKADAEAKNLKDRIKFLETSVGQLNDELSKCRETEIECNDKAREKLLVLERQLQENLSKIKHKCLLQTQELMEENNRLIQENQALKQGDVTTAYAKEELEEMSKKFERQMEGFSNLKKENNALKGKVHMLEEVRALLAKEKDSREALQKELGKCITQLQVLKEENQEYNQTKDRLLETETRLRNTYREFQEEKTASCQRIADVQMRAKEDTAEFKDRISLLENQLTHRAKTYLEETKALKEKLRIYRCLIKKLRFRLDSACLKKEELEAKHLALQEDCVPAYQYRYIQQQLQDIISKHNEFKAFIQTFENTETSLAQIAGFDQKLSFIAEKLRDLESAQNEAFFNLQSL